MSEAMYWKPVPVGKVRCTLCPHRCLLANNKTGICGVRYNKDGELKTKIYGRISSYSMDPIEKKPFYHFLPGEQVFSIGTWGCNLRCTMCQNWTISQQEVPTEEFDHEDITRIAKENKSIGVAYTYNEPFIGYEFMYDCAKYASSHGLKNVIVSNGFVSEQPLNEMLPYIDAVNVDLKGNSEAFYREICGGQLSPVMRTIKDVYNSKTHIEITVLVIPTLNDKKEDIEELRDWIADISPDIPVHFSGYFPSYKMNIDPTPVETLISAHKTASEKLNYVYMGNLSPGHGGGDTRCPNCGAVVIKRGIDGVNTPMLNDGYCGKCGEKIYGVFE